MRRNVDNSRNIRETRAKLALHDFAQRRGGHSASLASAPERDTNLIGANIYQLDCAFVLSKYRSNAITKHSFNLSRSWIRNEHVSIGILEAEP